MKKATLYGFKSEKEKILLSLQKCGEFMIVSSQNAQETPKKQEQESASAEATQALNAVKFIESYVKKKPIFSKLEEINYDEFISKNQHSIELTKKIMEISKSIEENKSNIISLNSTKTQLLPWKNLEVNIDEIGLTKSTQSFIGFIDVLMLEDSIEIINSQNAIFQQFSQAHDGIPVFIISFNQNYNNLITQLKNKNFSQSNLPQCNKTPQEFINNIDKQILDLQENIKSLEKQTQEMQKNITQIKISFDNLSAQAQREEAFSTNTQETFCITGWVVEDKTELVSQAVNSSSESAIVNFEDPQEDDIVPSATRNNKVVSQFEVVTNLYSRPAHSGFDPNTIMTPFYAIFFGMMVSDAGYGLLMTIALLLYKQFIAPKKQLPKLMNVLFVGSISTFVWGIMFGGYFGMSWFPPVLFSPLGSPMDMLILCYALGVIHLFVGVGVKINMEIKRKNFAIAIFDNLAWLVLITGLGLLILPATNKIGIALSISGAAVILLFAARDKKGVARLLGGLGSLYSVTGYLSDILSYSRLFALGLATGVIAMVINTICALVFGAAPIIGPVIAAVIFVGGHIFNIALNYLGAFVHDSRLQYIEFFSKFYESGGVEFTPLSFKTKYTDLNL